MLALEGPRPRFDTDHMTTAKWKAIRPESVRLQGVRCSQTEVSVADLLREPESYSGDELPHLVEHEGRLWIEDGHHRVLRAWLSGAIYIRARVLRP